jgi:hypothetical protein
VRHEYRGCGDLSRTHFGTTLEAAAKRGIPMNVTIEEAWALFLEQKGRCAVTGEPIVLVQETGDRRKRRQTASLDRIDPKQGYELDNVWWVHKVVNLMKRDYSVKDLAILCRAVVAANPSLLGPKMLYTQNSNDAPRFTN